MEERRVEKHRKMEEERETMRQSIRDKVSQQIFNTKYKNPIKKLILLPMVSLLVYVFKPMYINRCKTIMNSLNSSHDKPY